MPPDPKTLLEKFVVNNDNLERLESLLHQFNIFEAVGMVRQEIRHSHFLAFLLNPSASHGLGDIFLKTFLKRILAQAKNATVSPIDVDVAKLADTQVHREWKNIDILIISPASKIVCAIENKVDSGEHSNQLRRYREIVQQEFPTYRQIFVYLTPQGLLPYGETDQEHWSIYSYRKVTKLINDLCDRHRSSLQPEVCTLMQHYSTLINRHLMQDSEIAKLCRDIYLQHKEALDLIYEHLPAPETEVYELVKKLVKAAPSDQIVLDHSWAKRKIISFAVPRWDDFPAQKSCEDWTESRRILMLQFHIEPPVLKLKLTLGPGNPDIRQAIYQSLAAHSITDFTEQPFNPDEEWIFFFEKIISEDISPEMFTSDVADEVRHFWQRFLKDELPQVDKAVVQGLSACK